MKIENRGGLVGRMRLVIKRSRGERKNEFDVQGQMKPQEWVPFVDDAVVLAGQVDSAAGFGLVSNAAEEMKLR